MCVCLRVCVYTYGGDGWNKGEMKGRRKMGEGKRGNEIQKASTRCKWQSIYISSVALVQGESWNLAEEEFLLTKSHHLLWLLHSFPLTSVLFHLEIRRRAHAIDTASGATNLLELSFFIFSLHLRFLNAKTWTSNVKNKLIWNNSVFPKSLQVQTITPK